MPPIPRRHDPKPDWHRWYYTRRWSAIRMSQLSANPLCAMCEQQGRVTFATICDHVEPHRGNPDKFWGGKLQSLCKPCHDGPKQSGEKRGIQPGCNADGTPIDPRHHWNTP